MNNSGNDIDAFDIDLPKHLSHKISPENWNWINHTSMDFHRRYLLSWPQYPGDIKPWMIRGYWFITYFMNPSQENLTYFIKMLYDHRIFTEVNNLDLLEFVSDLKQRVHTS